MMPSPQLKTTKQQRAEMKTRYEGALQEAQAQGLTNKDLKKFVEEKLMDLMAMHYLFSESPAMEKKSSDPFCIMRPSPPAASTTTVHAEPNKTTIATTPYSAASTGEASICKDAVSTTTAALSVNRAPLLLPIPRRELAAPAAEATAPAVGTAPAPAAKKTATSKRSIDAGKPTKHKRVKVQPRSDEEDLLLEWGLEEELAFLDQEVAREFAEEDHAVAKDFWEDLAMEPAGAALPQKIPRQQAAPTTPTAQADVAGGPEIQDASAAAQLEVLKKQLASLQVDHFTALEEMSALETLLAQKDAKISALENELALQQGTIRQFTADLASADVTMAAQTEAALQQETNTSTLQQDLDAAIRKVQVFEAALGGAVRLMARAQQTKLLHLFSAGVRKMTPHVSPAMTGVVEEIANLPQKQCLYTLARKQQKKMVREFLKSMQLQLGQPEPPQEVASGEVPLTAAKLTAAEAATAQKQAAAGSQMFWA